MTTKLSSPRLVVAAAAAGCVALALLSQLPANAAPGAGTWTRISTPDARKTILSRQGHEGHLTVAGDASSDVTEVNVYCLSGTGLDVDATTVATAVPVTVGTFQATVPVPSTVDDPTTCRLRALPDGVNPQTSYLSSYAGPLLNLDVWNYLGAPGNEYDFFIQAGTGTGEGQFDSVNRCAVPDMATSQPDLSVPGGSHGCLAYVGTNAAATRMEISVDGHPVYATYEQFAYAIPGRQPVDVSVHAANSGTVSWHQTDVLLRCASDTFPPSGASCGTATPSGVSLRRSGTYGAADGHQVRLDDAFISTDGKKHRVRVSYQSSYDAPAVGASGLRIPGHTGFVTPEAGDEVTVLQKAAATLLIRSDTFADEGDPATSTWALTWSRTVSRLRFDPDDGTIFGLPMTLNVPRSGTARLRFVASEAVRTSRAAALAARAEKAMMPAPLITSPVNGAVISGRSTTVKGVVRAGANGLPTSVSVNGHAAKLTPNKAGTKATFTATFDESLGKHRLTVVAKDAGGNKRSTSVQVRNT